MTMKEFWGTILAAILLLLLSALVTSWEKRNPETCLDTLLEQQGACWHSLHRVESLNGRIICRCPHAQTSANEGIRW